jgi:hypothetical protein
MCNKMKLDIKVCGDGRLDAEEGRGVDCFLRARNVGDYSLSLGI